MAFAAIVHSRPISFAWHDASKRPGPASRRQPGSLSGGFFARTGVRNKSTSGLIRKLIYRSVLNGSTSISWPIKTQAEPFIGTCVVKNSARNVMAPILAGVEYRIRSPLTNAPPWSITAPASVTGNSIRLSANSTVKPWSLWSNVSRD